MARFPALTKVYAGLDGRDFPTVQNIARTIREAGFVRTTKRGHGASEMGLSDAVNLILGANGSEAAADAPSALAKMRNFQLVGVRVLGV